MRSLVCIEPGILEYKNIPAPELTQGHAIIKIKRVGICGTDLHAFEGNQPFFNYPRILGHELSGDLIEYDQAKISENQHFKSGEPVSIIPYFNCGVCIACRNGKPNCCVSLKVCGVHVDGALVDYLSVPVDSLIRSDGLNYDELALLEPLAIGAHAVRRAMVKEGEFVLILGAGPIGLAAMEFSKMAGGIVIALDLIESRLQFCRQKHKADYAFHGFTADLTEMIKEITHGDMPTIIMDATGNRQAINNAFQYMANSARYILIGLQKGEIQFSHPEFHRKEGTLMSSRNATREDFGQGLTCLKDGLINASDYITHRVSFENVKDEFANWLDPANSVIKVMVNV